MRLDRVVIGIDFSERSLEAARWVTRLLGQSAEFVLVHAISIPEPPPIIASRYPRRDLLLATVREGAEKRLREISLTLNADRLWLEILEGDPAACLTQVAEQYSAGAIVAGAHGERAGVLEGLGSIADRLVRQSTFPVLLVNEPRLTPISHILVAINKPDHARDALWCAAELSQRFDAKVTAMHVVTAGVASSALAAAAVLSGTPTIDLSARLSLTEPPDRWRDYVVAAGVPIARASSEVAFGEATREILAATARLDVDLVVIGRRESGNVRRAILGSVAEGVLRGARCPVLVVPEPV
jgi:nucleotide-binding universal stress UspA family protein